MSGLENLSNDTHVSGALAFGLQAAMFIVESASKIQDAEELEDYRRFLRAMQRLTRILTDVDEILQSKEDRRQYSRLYKVSKNCEDELVRVQKNILEWTGSGTRSRTIWTWGRFKTIALENTSRRRLESLESHHGFINFQLNRIQPYDRMSATEKSRTTSETDSIIPDTRVETLVHSNHLEEINATQQSASDPRSQNSKPGEEILVDNGINTLLNTGNIIRYAKELDPLEWQHFLEKVTEGYDFDDAVGWKVDCKADGVPLLHAIICDYATDFIWKAPNVRPDSYEIKETVRKLMLSGADAFARTPEGENCLHLVMQATSPLDCVAASDSHALLKDLLLFLIGEIGLDVRGETNAGISVTDLAFSFKCPSGRCLWPVWVAALLELGYDPLEIAKGSICFDQVEQLLAAAVNGDCSCPCCYPDSEDDDIEILDRSSVDEFLADEQELWESNESIDYPVSPESPQKTNSFHELNGLWDDNEFFEDLALNAENGMIYPPSYNTSANNLPRILEDWDFVNIE
ncbi:hypothetical protein TWF281_009623 [Arthrobotrys megalospora]